AARAGLAALAKRLGAQAAAAAAAPPTDRSAETDPAPDPARATDPAPVPAAPTARPASLEPVPEPASAFDRDEGAAAAAVASLAAGEQDRLVAFVGKLIVSKGIDLLIAAWPLVLMAEPRARLAVVGFGAYRGGVERLIDALADGDLPAVAALAAEGRAAEGEVGGSGSLHHLQSFLDDLERDEHGDAARYLAAARDMRERTVLTGRLEHDELTDLLPACEAQVVPSTFPEAFGMVAAEAAACGTLPLCADHSGLAEVSAALAAAVPAPARPLLSFPVGPGAVRLIAERLVAWLQAPEELREATRTALVATARELWSWEGVARGVLAAAEGRLDELPRPEARDTAREAHGFA
ncbi:MAG: glycosyl transferase group 1, partial [Conexibacter sp.]|nr:glycosyl transferase group 1 [Conexibacter sp.]